MRPRYLLDTSIVSSRYPKCRIPFRPTLAFYFSEIFDNFLTACDHKLTFEFLDASPTNPSLPPSNSGLLILSALAQLRRTLG